MDQLKNQVINALSSIAIDFGGGCSVSKAYLIAWLIRSHRITTSIDIGVYRGRSLVPQAIAHKLFTGGRCYGVDPWSNAAAREQDNPELREAIEKFATRTDFEKIYCDVALTIRKLGLDKHCFLVREQSSEAIHSFERDGVQFGLIHVDGNHDSDRVNADVSLYVPRLIPGGFVVMDDISWKSIAAAYAELRQRLQEVHRRQDNANDYAVFWNSKSRLKASWLRARLKSVGKD
jgi:Methyltransferase domain